MALPVTLTGCGPVDPAADELAVAATVAPHAWLVRQIAGDDASVVTVLPATADPHSHTPTDAEVTRLARCRVLFRAGVPFENGTWLRALTSRGMRVVDLRDGVLLLDDAHDHAEERGDSQGMDDGVDPHTWTSPRRLVVQAEAVASALVDLLPHRADAIRDRTHEVVARLTSLDAELSRTLAPYRGRAFYVHHPSWSYFAADYGLEQVAIEADGSEPSDAELTEWLRRARVDGIRVVFVQPQSADRAPRVVAESLGARVVLLDPLAPDIPVQIRWVADQLVGSWGVGSWHQTP